VNWLPVYLGMIMLENGEIDFAILRKGFEEFEKELADSFEKLRKSAIRSLSMTQNEDFTDEQLQFALLKAACLQKFLLVLKGFQNNTESFIKDWKTTSVQNNSLLRFGDSLVEKLGTVAIDPRATTLMKESLLETKSAPSKLIWAPPKAQFYREMDDEGLEIKNLCFAGSLVNSPSKIGSEGPVFNHKIPISQIRNFFEFFIYVRDFGGPEKKEKKFVKFSIFSFVCDGLLKFSKQHGENKDSMRGEWVKKKKDNKKKQTENPFGAELSPWISVDFINRFPLLYVYQSRTVLNFFLQAELVSAGNRGFYKASDSLNFESLQVALSKLPDLSILKNAQN